MTILSGWSAWAKKSSGDEKDLATLAQLKTAGDDPTKDHDIDFFFIFPKESSAKAAVESLKGLGHEAQVSASGTEFSVSLKKRMKPDLELLRELRQKFKRVAAKHSGEYDGWGTGVEK
ncbi:MAG: ribonuclease E inhibitor RraB [Bdellovibrionota bacterium]